MTNISGQEIFTILKYHLHMKNVQFHCREMTRCKVQNIIWEKTWIKTYQSDQLGPFWFYIHLFTNKSSVNGMDHNFCGGLIGTTNNTTVCSQMSLSQTKILHYQKSIHKCPYHKQKHSIITILRHKAQVFTKTVGTGISSGQCLMRSE